MDYLIGEEENSRNDGFKKEGKKKKRGENEEGVQGRKWRLRRFIQVALAGMRPSSAGTPDLCGNDSQVALLRAGAHVAKDPT